jgi:tetratricopeptide (TPR) repeat protein
VDLLDILLSLRSPFSGNERSVHRASFRSLPQRRSRPISRFLVLLVPFACCLPALVRAQVKSSQPSADFKKLSASADAARDADQLDRAATLYRQALNLRPQWVEGWWSLGTIEYDQNDYAGAASAFSKVKALDAKTGTARVMLGLCEFQLGQDASALRDIEAGKKLGIADDSQLWQVMVYHEGVLLRRAAKFEAAQQQLVRLCSHGVENSDVIRALGLTVLRVPGKDELPNNSPGAGVVSAVGHAECRVAQKKFDQARREYSEVVKTYPQYPNIHYAYGRFLLDLNDTEGAIGQFEQEIKNDPNHVFARLQIAAAKYRVDSKGGLPFAEAAVKLNPDLPLAHYLLGLLLLDTGESARAVPELETARRGFPNEAQVYFALGNAYARAGRPQDAARARATFLRLNRHQNPDSELNSYARRSPGALAEKPK